MRRQPDTSVDTLSSRDRGPRGAARFFQKGKRGVWSAGPGPRSFPEMVHEFLERQHRTIRLHDFIRSVTENKKSAKRLQGGLSVGIDAVGERSDGRAGRLEVFDL